MQYPFRSFVSKLKESDYLTFVLMTPFLGFFYTSFASIARLIDGVMQKRKAAQTA